MDIQQTYKNILVVLPNWVGDIVLATPTLKAIKAGFPESNITYLLRPHLFEIIEGLDWFDDILYWPGIRHPKRPKQTLPKLILQIKQRNFDLAIILPNSFKSALICSLGNIPRRVGYDRDARGALLTDKLIPDRYNGRFLPIPIVKYYLSIASYLGCPTNSTELTLTTTSHHDHEAESIFIRHSLDMEKGYAMLNPGASFGSSKCWPPEYFAKVGDYLIEEKNLQVLLACGPGEEKLAQTVVDNMKNRAVLLSNPIVGLGTLKSLIKNCKILITNDSGPRHIGIAFKIPIVTIFGPIDPQWTETHYNLEKKVMLPVDCGPCNKPTCPEKHHKCMKDLKPKRVIAKIDELLDKIRTSTV